MTQDKEKLLEQLEALKLFPKSKLVRELQKQIKTKLEKIQKKELVKSETKVENATKQTRSSKLKKYHRYLRMIRDNFPDLKYSDIRKQFSQRKKGGDVSIPDVVWQNPSP